MRFQKSTRPLSLAALLSLFFFSPLAGADSLSVTNFGAKGDGKTDDTAAFQRALDEAAKSGGGVVTIPKGNFFFAGHLNVPNAVTLKGIWESVPSHVGIRNTGAPKPTDDGTTLLVTEGAGSEEGSPFLTLVNNSTLKGVVIYYPNQKSGEGTRAVPLRDCHARQKPSRPRGRTAQPLQRHRCHAQ